jgi:hypothetical protein
VGETREPIGDGRLRGSLQGNPEGGADAPTDRVLVADPLSKGAPQVLLGVAREREVRRRLRGDAHPPSERRALLGRGDRTHGAHAGEHHAAAGQGVLEVRPRRQGAGRPDDPCEESRFGEREVGGGLAEEIQREGLHAGNAAERHVVEVELEDTVLGELGLQQQGEHRLARLAAE